MAQAGLDDVRNTVRDQSHARSNFGDFTADRRSDVRQKHYVDRQIQQGSKSMRSLYKVADDVDPRPK